MFYEFTLPVTKKIRDTDAPAGIYEQLNHHTPCKYRVFAEIDPERKNVTAINFVQRTKQGRRLIRYVPANDVEIHVPGQCFWPKYLAEAIVISQDDRDTQVIIDKFNPLHSTIADTQDVLSRINVLFMDEEAEIYSDERLFRRIDEFGGRNDYPYARLEQELWDELGLRVRFAPHDRNDPYPQFSTLFSKRPTNSTTMRNVHGKIVDGLRNQDGANYGILYYLSMIGSWVSPGTPHDSLGGKSLMDFKLGDVAEEL